MDTWQGAVFDHVQASGFDLVGAHAPLACGSCHGPDNELLFPAPAGQDDCVACHQPDYDGQHAGSGFATTCLDCHTVDTWLGAITSVFDLVGAHDGQCSSRSTRASTGTNGSTTACETCQLPRPTTSARQLLQSDYDFFATTCLDCHTNCHKHFPIYRASTGTNGTDETCHHNLLQLPQA